jgi:hypothetical protein
LALSPRQSVYYLQLRRHRKAYRCTCKLVGKIACFPPLDEIAAVKWPWLQNVFFGGSLQHRPKEKQRDKWVFREGLTDGTLRLWQLHNLGGINKNFRDTPPYHETRLVFINLTADLLLQPGGEGFAHSLEVETSDLLELELQ